MRHKNASYDCHIAQINCIIEWKKHEDRYPCNFASLAVRTKTGMQS